MNLDLPDPGRLVGFLMEVLQRHGETRKQVGDIRIAELWDHLFYLDPGRVTVSGPFTTIADLLLRTGHTRPGGAPWPKVVEWAGLIAVIAEDGSVAWRHPSEPEPEADPEEGAP